MVSKGSWSNEDFLPAQRQLELDLSSGSVHPLLLFDSLGIDSLSDSSDHADNAERPSCWSHVHILHSLQLHFRIDSEALVPRSRHHTSLRSADCALHNSRNAAAHTADLCSIAANQEGGPRRRDVPVGRRVPPNEHLPLPWMLLLPLFSRPSPVPYSWLNNNHSCHHVRHDWPYSHRRAATRSRPTKTNVPSMAQKHNTEGAPPHFASVARVKQQTRLTQNESNSRIIKLINMKSEWK